MSGLRRVDPERRRGPVYRGYAWLSATRPFGWVSRRIGWKLDPVLLGLTGGRLGAGLWLPTAVLETRGARTGAVRRNALIYFHDGDDVYARYRRRAAESGRTIPLVRLTPRPGGHGVEAPEEQGREERAK